MFKIYVEQEDESYREYTYGDNCSIAGYIVNIENSKCVDNKNQSIAFL